MNAPGPVSPAKRAILAEIHRGGPMPFERFMSVALYGEGGFFGSNELRSVKAGDFLTSPEVSPLFGETVGAFVASERQRIGEPFEVVEAGGGSGSLIVPLLGVVPVGAWAVEASPAAREALSRVIPAERVVAGFERLPARVRGVVVANELLDNLPMAIAQLTDEGWRERWVGADGEVLVFVNAPVRPAVGAWLHDHAGDVAPGGWVEVQLEAVRWLEAVLARLEAGSVLVFDYGDTKENLVPRRRDGTLRTYRAHHLGPHPLEEPGATDITADVNFSALGEAAASAGAEVEVMRQDDWLAAWGLRDRVSEMRHRELALARAGEETERLRVRTMRSDAEVLLHPRGLGDFRVLVARR